MNELELARIVNHLYELCPPNRTRDGDSIQWHLPPDATARELELAQLEMRRRYPPGVTINVALARETGSGTVHYRGDHHYDSDPS